MAGQDGSSLAGRVRTLVEPVANDLGLELVDVEVGGQGARRVVRLVADSDIDSPNPGVMDVDAVASLSRQASAKLDEQDFIPGSYTLEVSSPGVDRPLTRAKDFSRNVGRQVRVQLATSSADDAQTEISGTLREVRDDEIVLVVDGRDIALDLADVDHGRVVLPW